VGNVVEFDLSLLVSDQDYGVFQVNKMFGFPSSQIEPNFLRLEFITKNGHDQLAHKLSPFSLRIDI
jgi:hypothetical protein